MDHGPEAGIGLVTADRVLEHRVPRKVALGHFATRQTTPVGPARDCRCGQPTTSPRNRRLSLPVRPESMGLPRQKGFILFHRASVRLNRPMANSFRSLNHAQRFMGGPILNRPYPFWIFLAFARTRRRAGAMAALATVSGAAPRMAAMLAFIAPSAKAFCFSIPRAAKRALALAGSAQSWALCIAKTHPASANQA